jgi:hypothetical protein
VISHPVLPRNSDRESIASRNRTNEFRLIFAAHRGQDGSDKPRDADALRLRPPDRWQVQRRCSFVRSAACCSRFAFRSSSSCTLRGAEGELTDDAVR